MLIKTHPNIYFFSPFFISDQQVLIEAGKLVPLFTKKVCTWFPRSLSEYEGDILIQSKRFSSFLKEDFQMGWEKPKKLQVPICPNVKQETEERLKSFRVEVYLSQA